MVFEKSWWSCVALIMGIAGCSSPGKVTSSAPSAPELTATSSQALTSSNGVWQNGLTTNGVWQNGVWQNGVWQNGVWQNGVWQNGVWQNGVWQNGVWQNGVWQNGVWQNGVWQNGVWQNGVWQNGVWQNGVFQNGVWQNGVWQNGVWQNGVWQNGVWQNGVWQNGFANTALVTSQYTRQVLQYIYACAMPGTLSSDGVSGLYDTIIDPANPNHTCGDAGTCDAPYTCSSGFCVIPCASDHTCDPGYTCTILSTCVVPLKGAIGLGINADGTHWWDRTAGGDGGAGEAGMSDAGTSEASTGEGGSSQAGNCDESCQRWVSACVLARTNAYGVHVNISMRAPADAPQQIKDALAVSNVERNGDDAGTAGYTLREGAYYGNIFETTPVATSGSPVGPPTPGYTGQAVGPIAAVPGFYACAGPGSNIPEITKRFCSSQGDQVVIGVPGVCLSNPGGELGTCVKADGSPGEDTDPASPTFGAIQDCYTKATTQDSAGKPQYNGMHFAEVITVYLVQPISVCGNSVCEPPQETSATCPTDCHPGTWAIDLPFIGTGPNTFCSSSTSSYFNCLNNWEFSTALADGTFIVTGTSASDVNFGGDAGSLPASQGPGIVAKYNPDGTQAWTARFACGGGNGANCRFAGAVEDSAGNVNTIVLDEGNIHDQLQLTRLDGANGSVQLSTSLGITYPYLGRGMVADSQGNFIIGDQYGTLYKFSDQGSLLWQNDARPTSYCSQTALAIDSTDNIYRVCATNLTPSVIPGCILPCPSGEYIFGEISKFCPDGSSGTATPDGGLTCPQNGAVPWTHVYNGVPLYDVAVDGAGNVYGTGLPQATNVFTPGDSLPKFPTFNIPIVLKYNSDGSLQWVEQPTLVGTLGGNVAGAHIGFDQLGNVVVTSYGDPSVGGGIDFGRGPFSTYSSNNVFLAAYRPNDGKTVWAKQVPIVLNSLLLSSTVSHGRVVLGGNYSGSMQSDDRLLVTGAPETPAVVDSFLTSFPIPAPSTPPTCGAAKDQSGVLLNTTTSHLVAQATSSAGALVFFMPPTAIDNGALPDGGVDGGAEGGVGNAPPGVNVLCSPKPNTSYPIGTTTVTCTASDPFGDSSSCPPFTVEVVDTLPPLFSSFADVNVQATGPNGATVFYDPAATDQVDGAVKPVCTPPSGSLLGLGTTTVSCTATDAHGNRAHASFHVSVTAPGSATQCVQSYACQATGSCAPNPAPTGATCPATDLCMQTYTCQMGMCTGSNPVVCQARDQCHTAGTCDPATGACTNPAVAEGTACNGWTRCAQTWTCQGGTCVGSNPVVCAALDQCHAAGMCDPMMGTCTNPNKADGTTCDDGNACTTSDTCQAGACMGSAPVVCMASDQCHSAGTCNPATGACSNPSLPDGTSCSTHNVCTTGDSCESGVCTAGTAVAPPVITVPAPMTTTASGGCGAVVNYNTSVSDAVNVSSFSCNPGSGSTFPVGSTTVTCMASDTCGHSATKSFSVSVNDTAPTLSLPSAITAPVTGSSGGVVTYAATATDLCDGSIAPVCIPAPGSTFPIGTTLVSCTVTDKAGYTSTGSFTVTVVDTTYPNITVPQEVTAIASGGCGAVVSYSATASSIAGIASFTCTPPSGSTFPVGPDQVMCTAVDTFGNSASQSFPVIVSDTPPTLTVPSTITAQVTGPNGAPVTYTATASDLCDGLTTPTCTPASGSTFPIGTTQVNCSATDKEGLTGTASFDVLVIDTTPPVVHVPAPTSATATGPTGAVVTFTATVTDIVDGTDPVKCTPASGSTFALGTTTVTCNATDSHGNKATGTFQVLVQYAWSGILQPINADGSSIFKLGRTVPVKFQLTGASAGISNAVATLSVAKVSSNITGTYVEAVSTSAATTGNTFRYDSTSGQYIFNLSTSNLSTGTWQLLIDLHDGAARTVEISLR